MDKKISFTDLICKTIIKMKNKGYSNDDIVDLIYEAVDKHLDSLLDYVDKSNVRSK